MNGHIIPNSCIAVDTWRMKQGAYKYVHFLTHIHSDHTIGLTSTWHLPIYCSEITAYLLVERYGIKQDLIQILPLNQSVIVPISLTKNYTFSVTAFDANHCPGSIMLYFQGSFGSVLYTGDFRLSKEIHELAKKLSGQVETLYLDNTFCSPQCVFPSQEDCFNKIVDIINKHPNHRVIIGLRKIGKEALLGRLGVTLNETITVSSESYELCNLLFATNVFTTHNISKKATRLIVVPMETVARQLSLLNNIAPTIGIIPTAIFTGYSGNMKNPNMHIVPYSDHSSYPELVIFVSALRPGKIVPIVTSTKGPFNIDFSNRCDMSCFNDYLLQPRTRTKATAQLSITAAQPSKQPDAEGLTGTLSHYISATVKRRRLWSYNSAKKKAKAQGVVYCEDFHPSRVPAAQSLDEIGSTSPNTDHHLIECKDQKVVVCEEKGHCSPKTDQNSSYLKADEVIDCEDFDPLNIGHHPSDLPDHIDSRISEMDLCAGTCEHVSTEKISNNQSDPIDLTAESDLLITDVTNAGDPFQLKLTPSSVLNVNIGFANTTEDVSFSSWHYDEQMLHNYNNQQFHLSCEYAERNKNENVLSADSYDQISAIVSGSNSNETFSSNFNGATIDLTSDSDITLADGQRQASSECVLVPIRTLDIAAVEEIAQLLHCGSINQNKQKDTVKETTNHLVETPPLKVPRRRGSPKKCNKTSNHSRSKKSYNDSKVIDLTEENKVKVSHINSSPRETVPLRMLHVQETNDVIQTKEGESSSLLHQVDDGQIKCKKDAIATLDTAEMEKIAQLLHGGSNNQVKQKDTVKGTTDQLDETSKVPKRRGRSKKCNRTSNRSRSKKCLIKSYNDSNVINVTKENGDEVYHINSNQTESVPLRILHARETNDGVVQTKGVESASLLHQACDKQPLCRKGGIGKLGAAATEEITQLPHCDNNIQDKQKDTVKEIADQLVEMPPLKVPKRRGRPKKCNETSNGSRSKICLKKSYNDSNVIINLTEENVVEVSHINSNQVEPVSLRTLHVQETNVGVVQTKGAASSTLLHQVADEQSQCRKDGIASPAATLRTSNVQKRRPGRPRKCDQPSNDVVSLIRADRLKRTKKYFRKTTIGKLINRNSPNLAAAQTKKLMSLICSAVCSALLPLRKEMMLKSGRVGHQNEAPSSCSSNVSHSLQGNFTSPGSPKGIKKTLNYHLRTSDSLSVSDKEHTSESTSEKLSNQVHLKDSAKKTLLQNSVSPNVNKISGSKNSKICTEGNVETTVHSVKTLHNVEPCIGQGASGVTKVLDSINEKLANNPCVKDSVEKATTLSSSTCQDVSNVATIKHSNSTSHINKISGSKSDNVCTNGSTLHYVESHIGLSASGVKKVSDPTNKKLANHPCVKDKVEKATTLPCPTRHGASNIDPIKHSNSTNYALTNCAATEGRVKKTVIKYYQPGSKNQAPTEVPEEIIDLRRSRKSVSSVVLIGNNQTPPSTRSLIAANTSESISSDGEFSTSLDLSGDEHSSEFMMDTTITGPGRQKSVISNKVHFCSDCFSKKFTATSMETKEKLCFVCEKPIVKQNFSDHMFVNTLKNIFFRNDSVKK